MGYKLRDLVDFAAGGNATEFKKAFSSIVSDNINEYIENKKKEVSAKIISPITTEVVEESVELDENKKEAIAIVKDAFSSLKKVGPKEKKEIYALGREAGLKDSDIKKIEKEVVEGYRSQSDFSDMRGDRNTRGSKKSKTKKKHVSYKSGFDKLAS